MWQENSEVQDGWKDRRWGNNLLKNFMREETYSHVCWCSPVIPALGEKNHKKHEFKDNLGYIGWFYLKKEKRNMPEFMQCTN
jgi:hypothetical protein